MKNQEPDSDMHVVRASASSDKLDALVPFIMLNIGNLDVHALVDTGSERVKLRLCMSIQTLKFRISLPGALFCS